LVSLGVLIVLALVGVNMLLLLASGYVLAYAGVIFLGFGGSRGGPATLR
jgi:type IV secretion system protein TrbL